VNIYPKGDHTNWTASLTHFAHQQVSLSIEILPNKSPTVSCKSLAKDGTGINCSASSNNSGGWFEKYTNTTLSLGSISQPSFC
jgi:hypothetical protein